jgi:alanine-synthesizing transaminase
MTPMFAQRTNWSLAPNALAAAVEEHRAAGKALLDLTASNPTTCGLKYDEQGILEALVNPAALKYEPVSKGLLTAREAVAAYYAGRYRFSGNRFEVDPEAIFLTTSTSEAYSYLFRLLCDPGDELLVPAPSYPLFEFLADLNEVRLVPYALVYDHGWQMDFHSLEAALTDRSRGVLVVHPNNPTGSFVKAEEAGALSMLCARRSMAVIADEVFLDYVLDGAEPASFAGNRAALTFTLSGLSKIAALPQMKMAWIVVSGSPAVQRDAIGRLEVIADTYLSQNAPVQLATPKFLNSRCGLQEQIVQRVRVNLAELDRQLAGQKLCRRLHLEGGWYAVLRVPVTRSDEELAIALVREHSVFVHPGHFYDFPSDGYLVLSLLTPLAEFQEGTMRILKSFSEKL